MVYRRYRSTTWGWGIKVDWSGIGLYLGPHVIFWLTDGRYR